MIRFVIDEEGLGKDHRVPQMYKDNPELLKPRRATEGSAGYDLIAPYDFVIKSGNASSEIMDSYVKIEMDPQYVAYMHVRSSVGIKRFIRLMNSTGVIDSDFRDPIKVPLRIFAPLNEHVRAGEKIAQIVFHQYYLTDEDLELKRKNKAVLPERNGGIGSTDE